MGGFFGVVSNHDCVGDLFYGTDYHSHLGTKRGGLAVCDEHGHIIRRIHDISNAQFRSKFDDDLEDFRGSVGIGVISDYEDQPLIIASKFGLFAIVTVGKINNLKKLAEESFLNGCCHFSEMGDGELNPTELVSILISQSETLIDGMIRAQDLIEGSCSILILHDHKLYASRDKIGRTPIILGRKNGSYAVTMETTAFPNLDYQLKYELGPGEIVEMTAEHYLCKRPPLKQMKMCAFFWIYFGYPSSSYQGVNNETARYRNGALLAQADKEDTFIDTVSGIPDSGVAHAIGYSNEFHKPYQRAFVKYTPTWPRSFMPQNQLIRDLVARMKLIPIEEQITGKRLLFCDDSIVRGTQLKDTVKRLYERGAKEVHIRSACPPLLYGCKFLNFSRSSSDLALVARRAIVKLEEGVISDEIIKKYTVHGTKEHFAMVDIIRQELNLTSLKYQSLEKMLDAIGLPHENICTYCWNGCDV